MEPNFEFKMWCKMKFGSFLSNSHGRRSQEMVTCAQRRSDLSFLYTHSTSESSKILPLWTAPRTRGLQFLSRALSESLVEASWPFLDLFSKLRNLFLIAKIDRVLRLFDLFS